MESAALRSRSSQAKILGTIVSLAGAFVVTLYKGPPLVFPHQSPSISLHQPLLNPTTPTNSNWVLGGLLLTAEYILVPLWYIVQVNYAILQLFLYLSFFFSEHCKPYFQSDKTFYRHKL